MPSVTTRSLNGFCRRTFFLFTLYCGVFACGTAEGALKLQPGVNLKQEYNDNLLLKPDHEKADLVSTIQPFLRGTFDSNYLVLQGDYGLKFLFYKEHTDQNERDFKDVQRINLTGSVLPDEDFTVGFSETLARETIDEKDSFSDENDFLNKTSVNRLSVNPRYRLRSFRTFEPSLGYRFDRVDYESVSGDDYQRHTFNLELSKELYSDRLRLIAGADSAYHEASDSIDYRQRAGYGAAFFQLSSDLSVHGQIGKTLIDFDGGREISGRTGKAGAAYKFSSRLNTTIAYEETYSPSATSGTLKKESLGGNLTYEDFVTAVLSLSDQKGDYLDSDRRDRTRSANLRVKVPFEKQLAVEVSGGYAHQKFEPATETARRVQAGVTFLWSLNQADLSLGYLWRRHNSTIDTRDYENNTVNLGVSWLF